LPPPDLDQIEEEAPQKVVMKSETMRHGFRYNDQGGLVVGYPRQVKEEPDLMLEAELDAPNEDTKYPDEPRYQHIAAFEENEQSGRPSETISDSQDTAAAETAETVETTKWLDTKVGPAPKEVEDFYDIHLDAMRLPTGVVT